MMVARWQWTMWNIAAIFIFLSVRVVYLLIHEMYSFIKVNNDASLLLFLSMIKLLDPCGLKQKIYSTYFFDIYTPFVNEWSKTMRKLFTRAAYHLMRLTLVIWSVLYLEKIQRRFKTVSFTLSHMCASPLARSKYDCDRSSILPE